MKNSGIKGYNANVVAENAKRLSMGLPIELGEKEKDRFDNLQKYFSEFTAKRD